MSHTQRHIPLAPPLVDGSAHRDCVASVVIPARNEQGHLHRTLDALRRQQTLGGEPLDPHAYEVVLLLNNCTDGSAELARDYASAHPSMQLLIVTRELAPEQAHVGTARRLLMDTAYERLRHVDYAHCAILSTDGDTVVAPDWVSRNMAAIEGGADVVGGVIHLFPDELDALRASQPETVDAYERDRLFQRQVARLEALLDPDPADPWPRHLEHFGASLACTPAIYALSGGLPPVKPLEDVAFIDALRKVGARIRHCPDTHIFTSARLHGRVEIGLSGQLRHWQDEAERGLPHRVDSAAWLLHRFRTLHSLRRLNESRQPGELSAFPDSWHERLRTLHADRWTTPRFLELLDCNLLIEEMFAVLGKARHDEIGTATRELSEAIAACESSALLQV